MAKKGWQALLDKANKDLKQYGARLKVSREDNTYTLDVIWTGQLNYAEDYACGYYEEELAGLINEAWAHVRAKTKAKQEGPRYTQKQMENAVMLAADLYQRLYDSDLERLRGGALEVAGTIISEAVKMEAWLTEKYGPDDDEYLDRLEEYEADMELRYGLRMKEWTKPEEVELYSIEPDGRGGKQIHILAYTYESDNETKDYWRMAEGSFLIVPLPEFIDNLAQNEDYVSELWCEAKQYEGDYTPEQIVDTLNHYFNDHTPDRRLAYSEITADTPCGNYVC